MINIRSVVNQAYQLIGVISLDEVASGIDSQIAILKLNDLISQMNVDQLFPFTRKVITQSGLNPQNTYTIGLLSTGPQTADIQEARPSFINRIQYFPNLNSMPLNVQQVDLPDLLYRRRTQQAIGTPMYFAVDGAYPIETIYFDIKPQQGSSIQIICNEVLPEVTIASTLSAPPEYSNLLICALARHLSVLKQMPSDTQANIDALCKEAINRVKSSNGRSQIPTLDDLMGASNYRVNNIYTGNASR